MKTIETIRKKFPNEVYYKYNFDSNEWIRIEYFTDLTGLFAVGSKYYFTLDHNNITGVFSLLLYTLSIAGDIALFQSNTDFTFYPNNTTTYVLNKLFWKEIYVPAHKR